MAVLSIEELYALYIKPLPPLQRLRLLELTAHELALEGGSVTLAPYEAEPLSARDIEADIEWAKTNTLTW